MKSIINFSLNNKLAIWILTFILVFGGIYAGMNMKQELIPNIDIPYLTVTAVYPGASPEGVLENVTLPLEQRLKNLSKVKNLNSMSMENASYLIIEYEYGTDLDRATDEIKEIFEQMTFPDGVQKPTVSKFSMNSFPVVSVSVAGNVALEEITKITEQDIAPALGRIDGVASVQVSGQYLKEVQIKFDQDKLVQYGLTEDTIKAMIQANALKVPLGIYELDQSNKAVVIDGNITTIEDLLNVQIPYTPQMPTATMDSELGNLAGMPDPAQGTPTEMQNVALTPQLPTVALSELATVEVVGYTESISRTNGLPSLGVQVVKANDANTVEVVNAVKDAAKEFEEKYPGLEIDILLDQAQPIQDAVSTMLSKALYGGIFAIIVILLFLRNIRSTLISIISIPLSLLIALLVLWYLDISLNIMTIGAMTVAIGRVVDDSIVVIENIYRRMSLRDEPLRGKDLIREATREMFIPIMSSTIVTIAVFLPLALVSGMVGEMFLPFALTIVFALLASLLVAITIVPMLAHTLFRNGLKKKHIDRPSKLRSGYQSILNWCLDHKLITFGLAILLLVGSFALVPIIGISFLPDTQYKYVLITYSPNPGDLLEDVEQRALEAEKIILDRPNVVKMQYSVGGSNPLQMNTSKSALFYIQYDPDTKNFDEESTALLEDLRQAVPVGEWSSIDMSSMGFGGNNLTLYVYGETYEQIIPIVDQIVALAEEDPNFEDVETNLSTTYEQYTIVADQQKLSSLGLTAGQIAMKIAPISTRPTLTEVVVDDKTYKVYVESDQKEFKSIEDIKNETITSPLGIEVPIKDVAEIEVGTTQNTISRLNGRLMVEISAKITIADVSKATSNLEDKIKEQIDLPLGMEVSFSGVAEQINETFTQLGVAMLAAIGIVYFVLVVTFGGGLAPFAILFSLPFAIIGGLVALLIAGETISASAMMGALMLIGIVVTNAIVLIDRVIHKEKEGLSTREALLEAGGTRLRPILMTAFATVGALLPLAFGFEDAGVISRGLGVTVIGGLTSSTLLTLVIVPIVYEFLMKFTKKNRRRNPNALPTNE